MTHTHGRKMLIILAMVVAVASASAVHAGYQEGLDYYKSGKYVEAAAEFQALVDQSPEYDSGYYLLGICFLQLKKLEDAEKNFRKAIELNGDKFDYHHKLATVMQKRRKNAEVVKIMNAAEGLAADNKTKNQLHVMRGFAYAGQKKWSETINDLEQANKLKPAVSVQTQLAKAYYLLNQSDKAVTYFEKALAKDSKNAELQRLMAESSIKLGLQARDDASKKKHYGRAMQAAERFKTLKPGTDGDNLIGKAALGAKQYPKAVEAFTAVVKKDTKNCYAMVNLGKTYIAMNQFDNAEKPLKDAAACAPRMSTVYESLGLIYQKRGKAAQEKEDANGAFAHYDTAKKYYNQASGIKSTNFISQAISSIDQNIEVIKHNMDQDAIKAAEDAAIAAELARQKEEEAKRAEWEKKKGGGRP